MRALNFTSELALTTSTLALPVDLSALHTFGLSARARSLRRFQTENELLQAIEQRKGQDSPSERLLLGEGSNTVFLSPEMDLEVWQYTGKGIQVLGQADGKRLVCVQGGENWHAWVERSLHRGWWGLENLALIPGSVGACPVQNIGAYGLEVCERIEKVRFVDWDSGEVSELTREQCGFGYRDSIFKNALAGRGVITEVTFALPLEPDIRAHYKDVAHQLALDGIHAPTPHDVFDAVVKVRTAKLPDPMTLGNAGSFFKNPVVPQSQAEALAHAWPGLVSFPADEGKRKLAAGWLIDRVGLKGYRAGDAGVSAQQALVLVNHGHARPQDLRTVIHTVQTTVEHTFGVRLEVEPNIH